MASKKASSPSKKELKATIRRLEAKLERADTKAARWKKEAKRHASALASSQAPAEKPDEEVTERRPARRPTTRRRAKPPLPAEEKPTEVTVSADTHPSAPDASWTLAQLRAEARSRGLTGLSGKTKAQVIAALT